MNKELYKQLVNHYKDKQIIVAIEELSELIQALTKDLRGKTNIDNIIEEVADVKIILEQLVIYYGIDEKTLNEAIDYKEKRTKERLIK